MQAFALTQGISDLYDKSKFDILMSFESNKKHRMRYVLEVLEVFLLCVVNIFCSVIKEVRC